MHASLETADLEVRRLTRDLLGNQPDRALVRLSEVLPAHFAFELRPGGFFARMAELGHDPELGAHLKSEHQGILDDVARLRSTDPLDRGPLLRALARRLRKYEQNEARYCTSSPGLTAEREVFPA